MAKAANLVNQKFGKLIVIGRAENNSRGNTQWLCKCECGSEKVALGYDLMHGRTTSCGCAKYETRDNPIPKKDLTGMKFGKLTVESLCSSKGKRGILKWICKCECGREVIVQGQNLKSGHSTSCGKGKCRKQPVNTLDMTGQRFGRLVVLKISSERSETGKIQWDCICDCGNTKKVVGTYLRSGRTKSCGCLSNETRRKSSTKTHGQSKKRIYREWVSMKKRCDKTYHGHKGYYDKGITFCDEWNEFEVFYEWALANGYQDNLTLDRKDNDGNYEPSNCRWATPKEQANNKSNNVYIEYNGKIQTLKQWSEELELSYGMLKARHQRGWMPPELFEPNTKK